MKFLPAILALMLFVAACTSEVPTNPPTEPASLAAFESRIDELVKTELQWRYPNTHASTLSQAEFQARQDQQYDFIQQETRAISGEIDSRQRLLLVRSLKQAPGDDECRVIVLARLCAAAGTPRAIIEENIPQAAHGIAFIIGHAIDQGLKLRA